MKKYFYLILAIVLFTPMIVLGDSAGPSILGYEAVITNKNGVQYETYDNNDKLIKKTIPYNAIVNVMDEWKDRNGNITAMVCYPVNENCYYGNIEVSLKDIMPVKDEIVPSVHMDGVSKVDYNAIVFEKGGINLKKGPADIYGYYDKKIPYRESIRITYEIPRWKGGVTWYYIDDEDYRGWVDVYENAVAINKFSDILVFSDTKFLDGNNNILLTIPSETVLNNVYYIEKMNKYYLKYNNQEGYLNPWVQGKGFLYNFDFGYKIDNGYVLTAKNSKITSIDGKTRIDVPMDTKLNVIYGLYWYIEDESNPLSVRPVSVSHAKELYYVTYNGTKGFIDKNDVVALKYDYSKVTMSLNKDVEMYNVDMFINYSFHQDEDNLNSYMNRYKMNEIIPKGTTVTTLYDETLYDIDEYKNYNYDKPYKFYLVYYNGKMGFITTNDYEIKEEEKIENIPVSPKTEKKKTENKSENVIVYAVLGAVIISAVAIATIVLINGKKNNKIKEKNKNEKNSNNDEKTIKNIEKDTEKKD